jgi:hypothetical protein
MASASISIDPKGFKTRKESSETCTANMKFRIDKVDPALRAYGFKTDFTRGGWQNEFSSRAFSMLSVTQFAKKITSPSRASLFFPPFPKFGTNAAES